MNTRHTWRGCRCCLAYHFWPDMDTLPGRTGTKVTARPTFREYLRHCTRQRAGFIMTRTNRELLVMLTFGTLTQITTLLPTPRSTLRRWESALCKWEISI